MSKTRESLTALYADWLKIEHIPPELHLSADELLYELQSFLLERDSLVNVRRQQWLSRFIEDWEEMEEADRAAYKRRVA